jgi:hypothetical protein
MEDRVIGYHGRSILDIVTFRITSQEVHDLNVHMGRRVLQGSKMGWPPWKVKEDEQALFVGIPGRQRIDTPEESSFGRFALLSPVSSTNERHFGFGFDRSKWVDAIGKGLPPERYDLGGISGAPVIIIDEPEGDDPSWHLGGVAYEAMHEMAEIVYCHHASFINADGTLNCP